jgi:hypothetical protein
LGQGDFWLFDSSIGLNACKNFLKDQLCLTTKEEDNLNNNNNDDDFYDDDDNNSTREFNETIINKIRKIFEK